MKYNMRMSLLMPLNCFSLFPTGLECKAAEEQLFLPHTSESLAAPACLAVPEPHHETKTGPNKAGRSLETATGLAEHGARRGSPQTRAVVAPLSSGRHCPLQISAQPLPTPSRTVHCQLTGTTRVIQGNPRSLQYTPSGNFPASLPDTWSGKESTQVT